MSIIVNLDIVMAREKISLKELSKRVNISEQNLSKLKNCHVKAIRFTTLNAICKALNCQPGDLLEFKSDC
ncbi:helix-turn-helix transcriptional regulator [Clostridiaceae bacterium M8S5]|nr:helix-turn-helix transcriptional regulator [Clostridiaceae bacterium M8S5]